ncbi:MAG: efflux RND transporter permease subunit, partial [Deltaproteobacteria bacterium]|nr:efflux RND transporter permease subunit [Deltaproteobacteria bacterium]
AATFATSEIGLAVMATTFAIVGIFLPVAFMKGIIGRFFLQFALTIVFAVMVSLLVSFTLTPMMASIFLKTHKKSIPNPLAAGAGTAGGHLPAREPIWKKAGDVMELYYKKLEKFYRRVLEFTLGYRKTVLIGALIIFVLSLGLTTYIGKEFIPPEDQGIFMVRMEGPIDYSVEQLEKYYGKTEELMREIPEIKSVFFVQGYGG